MPGACGRGQHPHDNPVIEWRHPHHSAPSPGVRPRPRDTEACVLPAQYSKARLRGAQTSTHTGATRSRCVIRARFGRVSRETLPSYGSVVTAGDVGSKLIGLNESPPGQTQTVRGGLQHARTTTDHNRSGRSETPGRSSRSDRPAPQILGAFPLLTSVFDRRVTAGGTGYQQTRGPGCPHRTSP